MITRVILQREDRDCAVCALAMYLGHSYEDVLRVVATTDRSAGKHGLWTATIKRAADKLGHRLRVRKRFDWDEDYGILLMPDHATVLRNGLVIDNGLIWEHEAFLLDRHVEPFDCELLEAM